MRFATLLVSLSLAAFSFPPTILGVSNARGRSHYARGNSKERNIVLLEFGLEEIAGLLLGREYRLER